MMGNFAIVCRRVAWWVCEAILGKASELQKEMAYGNADSYKWGCVTSVSACVIGDGSLGIPREGGVTSIIVKQSEKGRRPQGNTSDLTINQNDI